MAPAPILLVVVQEPDAEEIVLGPAHFAAIDRAVLHLQVEGARQHLAAAELQLGAAVGQIENRAVDQALTVVEKHPRRPRDLPADGRAAIGNRIVFGIHAVLSAGRAATPSTSTNNSGAASPATIMSVLAGATLPSIRSRICR